MEESPTQNPLATAASAAAAALLVTVLLAWIWRVAEWVWLRPKRLERRLRQQGIAVNPYQFFHGDLREMRRMGSEAIATPMTRFCHDLMPRVRPFLHQTFTKHGKVSVTWEGPVAVVNVGDAELAKEVLNSNYDFHKPKSNPLTALLVRGLFSYDGNKWAHHRKLINPAFHLEKLKLMVPAFYTCCAETLRIWEQNVLNGEHEIEVWNDLATLSADAISRAAFGSSYKEGRRIFQLITNQISINIRISQSVYFPGRSYLPTKDNRKMKAADKEIRALLRGIIHKRKKEDDPKEDLLGLLLESSSAKDNLGSKINKQKILRITIDELIDECVLFYIAGQETTSTLLIWTMILLAKHQDWQARAREEVLQVFGTKKPEFEGLSHLKIMNMIFHEVLRLYPPVIEITRRVVDDNTKLGSLTLPKGALINLPLLYIHHDPKVWGEDANEFNPERFSQGISKASKGNASFLGFGWGPRICIGLNFAMCEVKVALSMILQCFEFRLSPSYVHAPAGYGLLRPQFGAPIIFERLRE